MSEKGFTLIELMIVVAIIGILAAIAVPQYQDYIARTQVQRVVGEVGNRKTMIEEFVLNGWYTFNEADIGWSGSNLTDVTDGATPTAGDGLQILSFSTSLDGYGYLMATVGQDSAANVTGVNVYFEREQEGNWACAIEKSGAGFWKDSYLPTGCTLIPDGATPSDD